MENSSVGEDQLCMAMTHSDNLLQLNEREREREMLYHHPHQIVYSLLYMYIVHMYMYVCLHVCVHVCVYLISDTGWLSLHQ